MYHTSNTNSANDAPKSTFIDGKLRCSYIEEKRRKEAERIMKAQKDLEEVAKWNREHPHKYNGVEFYGYTQSGKKVLLRW